MCISIARSETAMIMHIRPSPRKLCFYVLLLKIMHIRFLSITPWEIRMKSSVTEKKRTSICNANGYMLGSKNNPAAVLVVLQLANELLVLHFLLHQYNNYNYCNNWNESMHVIIHKFIWIKMSTC